MTMSVEVSILCRHFTFPHIHHVDPQILEPAPEHDLRVAQAGTDLASMRLQVREIFNQKIGNVYPYNSAFD